MVLLWYQDPNGEGRVGVVAVVTYERSMDGDPGRRIDYRLASPGLAASAVKAEVYRAPSYAEHWSDHAPGRGG